MKENDINLVIRKILHEFRRSIYSAYVIGSNYNTHTYKPNEFSDIDVLVIIKEMTEYNNLGTAQKLIGILCVDYDNIE